MNKLAKIIILLVVLIIIFLVIRIGFWYNFVEIYVDNENISEFNLKTNTNKNLVCKKNCKLKIPYNQVFRGIVQVSGFFSKNIEIEKNRLWKTTQIHLTLIEKNKIEVLSLEDFGKKAQKKGEKFEIENSFGNILYDLNGKFAIFAKKRLNDLHIFIQNSDQKNDLLTTIENIKIKEDDFSQNFKLSSTGIVIPTKNNLIFYNFLTQKKEVLWSKSPIFFSDISVAKNTNFVAKNFDGQWHIFSKNKEKNINGDFIKLQFLGNKLFKISRENIFLGDDLWFKLDRQINDSDEVWIENKNHKNIIFVKTLTEIWAVEID